METTGASRRATSSLVISDCPVIGLPAPIRAGLFACLPDFLECDISGTSVFLKKGRWQHGVGNCAIYSRCNSRHAV